MVTIGKNGGLFGYAKDGKILNLGLTSGTINIGGTNIGVIANSIENGVIDNCYSNINLSVGSGAAGIVYNVKNSNISNCYNTGNMSSGGSCAGIAVNVENSKISNCYNTGDLCNGGPRAGIVYSAKNTTISNCYNIGTIYSYQAGGIVSVPTDSVIINCYNKGNISDSSYAGGIVGYQAVNTTIKNCYNNGNVSTSNSYSSNNYAGGIVSYDLINSEIINCNNTGEVISSSSSGTTYSGGIVGNYSVGSKIIECYNKGKVTSKNFGGGIVGSSIVENSIISSCYNMGDISVTSSMPIGGLAYNIIKSTVTNCYNTGKVTGTTAPAGGLAYTISDSKISNCYNLGDVECNNVAGGLAQYISKSTIINCYNEGSVTATYPAGGLAQTISESLIINSYNKGNIVSNQSTAGGIGTQISSNSKIINCYNQGNVISNGSAPVGGLTQSISNSEVINFYNTGILTSSYGVGGVTQSASNTTMKNCYYLNTTAEKGIYNTEDIQGQVEAKTEEQMKSENFAKLLNSNIKDIKSDNILIKWEYKKDSYPEVDKIRTDKEVTITNEKAGKVIVHHYLEGTGPENAEGRQPVLLADDEILKGRIDAEYTTSPNMNIEGYILIKDEHGEYIVPENASGEFKEEEQHVYYYYNKKKLELTVHHYLEGTENKVPLGENEEGKELFAEDEYSEHNEGDHYKTTPSAEVLKTYELVGVVGDEEKDITQNEVVTYYYKIKKHEITTRVEIPEGRDEEDKGGSISGEGLKPYETVDYGKTSKKDIIVKPDENYRIKQIKLVSTNEEGNKQESIIYIEGKASEKGEQENAEITYKKNSDGSLTLTKFENMTEDKEVIVVFEKDAGKLIVHHYIEGTTEKIYDDQVTIEIIGSEVETSPVKVENYVVVQEPADRIGTITKQVQEKIYYYQRQYKVTTDIIKYEEPNEAGEMEEVVGGTISGKGESSYEEILKGRNNQKEIVMAPNEGFQITKITINGQDLDYYELLKEDGSITLEQEFFKNVDEDKHIEVEFRRKTKVHVKYLEAGTKNILAEEETIEGYVGKDFETERKNVPNYKIAEVGSSEGITNEKEEKVEPNGQMTKDEITIIYWYEKVPSGILVKHVEKVVTKKINEETGKEEITITGVILDEEVIPGYAGESKNTERRLEGKYEGYVSAENLDYTEGINVAKDENEKIVTMKQDEVVEVIYWYEKAFKITTDVKEHEETKVNEETGKSETVKIKGGSISGEDEIPYESVIRSNDSTKEIKIVPEEGYRIKQVTINGEEIFIKDKIAEDKSLTLTKENGYFKNVQEDKHIEVEFEKIPARVIVHYYLQGTGEEFENEPVVLADEDIIIGTVNGKYITIPNMDIEGYTLIKDEKGEYILPENKTGIFTEKDTHVYYYYTKDPFELIVHHYLEGTKEKLDDDEYYYYDEGTHYKTTPSEEVLVSYELVKVVGDEEKDITKNEEVIYYYRIKKYEIITRVEIPEEEINSGRTEKGGTISGEGQEPYETVDYGKTSIEDIVIKPDLGYRISKVKLVSTNEEGVKKESVIYINGDESEKEEQENAEITYTYNLDGSIILTKFENMTEDKEVIVVFEPVIGKVIVHHYIEGTQEKISEDEITEDLVGTEVQTKPVEKENYMLVEEPEEKNTIITEDTQEKIYYYQRQYKVTTNIIKYEEPDENGKMKEVIGGTISGKGETSYEDILKGRNSQKEIEITPKDGFQITKITINGKEFDYSELLKENSSVILPKEFFKNVEEDKHVEVEFRRKTKVHVKYLEAETKKVLAEEELIEGYVGKNFETERKNITNYKTAKVGSETGITNEDQEAVEPNGQMTKDEITIIYWYEKIPAGIIVKHIEKVTTKTTNEETGKEEIKITGVLLDEEEIKGYVGESKNTERRKLEGKFENYIPAENKEATQGINVRKEENSKTVRFKENEVTEVIYWYEKEYKITTDVIEHKEIVVNLETGKEETVKVKGGSISGENETPYESVIRSNDSTKEIKIVPDKGYRIKQILINDKEMVMDEKVAEDGSITLKAENGYFTNMQEDKHIKVEFEKIPAKVIVKYKDSYTKESIAKDKITNGYVDDKYNETRQDFKNYIPEEPEPENSTGTMTKETITITYWYTREFKITTDVKEHEEKIINSETGKEETLKVKGGSITGEDAESYEVVTRGKTSAKEIIIKPENGYRIKLLKINGKEIEIKDLVKEDNTIELPFFENMQEDKHIVVEFEKIPAKVIVKYLEEGTEKTVYKTEEGKEYEEIEGFINDKYETKEKEIPYYELVKEKYPKNSNGSMTEKETEVKYYYKKLLFNMKVEKEIEKIILNGQNVEVTDKNKQKLEIKYKDLNETKLKITYKIKVTNTEKVEGIAIIEEILPEGFEFMRKEDETWKEKDGKYTLTTEVINPGETKEYEITLKWNPEEANKGQKVNTAKIANTVNIPEYKETTLEDNEDTAIIEIKLNKTIEDVINDIKDDVVNMPKTGQARIVYIVAVTIAGTCIGIIVWRKRKIIRNKHSK